MNNREVWTVRRFADIYFILFPLSLRCLFLLNGFLIFFLAQRNKMKPHIVLNKEQQWRERGCGINYTPVQIQMGFWWTPSPYKPMVVGDVVRLRSWWRYTRLHWLQSSKDLCLQRSDYSILSSRLSVFCSPGIRQHSCSYSKNWVERLTWWPMQSS